MFILYYFTYIELDVFFVKIKSGSTGAITLAVCFVGDNANEEVVNRCLDFYEAELPS